MKFSLCSGLSKWKGVRCHALGLRHQKAMPALQVLVHEGAYTRTHVKYYFHHELMQGTALISKPIRHRTAHATGSRS